MNLDALIADKIEDEIAYLDELIAASVSGIERDFGPDPEYRAQLEAWRAKRIDILEAAIRGFIGRLN